MADIVSVLLCELVIGDGAKCGAPECDCLIGGEANAFKKQCIL